MPILLRFSLLAAALLAPLLSSPARAADPAPRTILFYGDSLTAGYGLDDPSTQAYPGLIAEKIAAAGLPYRVINAGLSGETSSGGLRRIDWVLRQPVDVFVLALGSNDGLRGLPLETVRTNLRAIFDRVKARNPDAALVLLGMRMPANMGGYAAEFHSLFAPIAAAYDAPLVPYLLDGVGGDPAFNLPDGIHPNPTGHQRIAATVWPHLAPVLHSRAE
jgi:acyl-CoA thioesterase-1